MVVKLESRCLQHISTNPMLTGLHKFRALPSDDRATLLMAMLLLPLCRIGLRMLGLERFSAWLARAPHANRPPPSLAQIMTLAKLVNMAANHGIGPPNCLTRSLLLRWLLQRHSVAAQLRIGVRLVDGRLEAHAWIEYQGMPVNDVPEVTSRYEAFDGPASAPMFPTP